MNTLVSALSVTDKESGQQSIFFAWLIAVPPNQTDLIWVATTSVPDE